MSWQQHMQSQLDTELSDFRGITIGKELAEVQRIAVPLQAELHSSYCKLLEHGLRKLIGSLPERPILVIELLLGSDYVIFARQLQLTQDYNLAVLNVTPNRKATDTHEFTLLHWNLRVKNGH